MSPKARAGPRAVPPTRGRSPSPGAEGPRRGGMLEAETVRMLWRGLPYLGCALRCAPENRETKHSTSDLPPSVLPWGPTGFQQERVQRGKNPGLWSVGVSFQGTELSGQGGEWAWRGTWGQWHSDSSPNDRAVVEREAQHPCQDRSGLKANFRVSKKVPSPKKHASSPASSPGVTVLLTRTILSQGVPLGEER